MIDLNVKIIQGFSVPYDKLFKETSTIKSECNHEFDRNIMKFCPSCGKKSKLIKSSYVSSIINIDFNKLYDNDNILENDLRLLQANTYGELPNKNYIIGIESYSDNPNCPDKILNFIKPIEEYEIILKIENYKIEIPYDKNSFGIYLLNESG